MASWVFLLRKISKIGHATFFIVNIGLSTFQEMSTDTAKNLWIGRITLSIPEFILYLTKDKKRIKFNTFSLKTRSDFSSLLNVFFFSLNNKEKALYVNAPEMLDFNPKTSIRKDPIFSSWYNIFCANVSDFYRHFTAKSQKLWAFISLKKIKLY